MELVRRLWCEQEGQDIAEYAVMLAVILVTSAKVKEKTFAEELPAVEAAGD